MGEGRGREEGRHDTSPLSEYGIQDGAVLTLQLRLSSGSRKLSTPQLVLLTPAALEVGTLSDLRTLLMGKKAFVLGRQR